MNNRYDITVKNVNPGHVLRSITYRFVGLTKDASVDLAKELAGDSFRILVIHGGLRTDISED
jgi:hypothetical protein